MPYIEPAKRRELDPEIDALAGKIVGLAKNDATEGAFAGYINYACTRLAMEVVRLRFGRIRYWLIALVSGTFRNVADEFYRRLAAPYEDKMIRQNQDVDMYEQFVKDIESADK